MSDKLQQICPSSACRMPIYEYDRQETPDTLDLHCPECGEHVAHLTRSDLEALVEIDHD